MQPAELIAEGQRIATICNSCRYCEGLCAVFPAIEARRTFAEGSLDYLANLCHSCTECLPACPFSPPHPFAVNVPLTLAKLRLRSYEKYCWPRALGVAFRSHGITTVVGVVCALTAALLAATSLAGRSLVRSGGHTSFYDVVPHTVMAGAFGAVFLLVVTAMCVSVARFVKQSGQRSAHGRMRSIAAGFRDALSLKYLHGSGEDCSIAEGTRTPWRRLFHHATLYGFALCFASTIVASMYALSLHRSAPYPVFSVPVVLGMIGGMGLIVGPSGLWATRARRDPATLDPAQRGLDRAFMLLLLLTSGTGLILLAFRHSAAMPILLIVHLAVVFALLASLPYGKFMHGLYRAAALIRYANESRTGSGGGYDQPSGA
jgi:citrate/tricarballylate utilization protein